MRRRSDPEPTRVQFFFNLHFRGGPLDGKECEAIADPGDVIEYAWLDLLTRKRRTSIYRIERSYNFERFYAHESFKLQAPPDAANLARSDEHGLPDPE